MADKLRTLSAAIRLGATFRPQCRNELFGSNRSCALGAAAEAVGVPMYADRALILHSLIKRFPVLDKVKRWDDFQTSLQSAIIHRNDFRKHSREAIADWLETQGL